MKQANVINNSQSRDSERYKRSLLAASMVLLFAAQCQGGLTTIPVVSGITSSTSSPGGFIFDGTNSWVADAKLGLCRMDPPGGGGGGFSLSNCVLPPTSRPGPGGVPAIIGQPAYDPATGFVYLPDQSTASMGIWRYHFNGSVFNTPVNIATTLGGQRPGAIAFGVPTVGVTDGSLYVTMTANSNIVRVTTPEAAAQTVATMSTTISGLPAHGLAKVGTQLWVADRDGIIDIVDPVGCANKCRGAIQTQIFGLASPLSVTWDAINSYVYIGTPAGVIRHARITGVTDTYSSSYGAPCVPGIPGLPGSPICPGLFSNVTAVGLDGAGNLLLVDDPSAGQPFEASVYTVPFFVQPLSNPPVQTPPDGQGATPQPPITQLPTIFPDPIANPGVLYSNGLTTPKGAVFMGTHLWVVDTALGFCKVVPALPSPSLTACAVLPAGFVPGAPAFQPSIPQQAPAAATQAYAYLPDTTPGGAGILRFPFITAAGPTNETLGAPVTVLSATKLAAAAPGATAPTSLAFGPDQKLYVAMAGVPNILRITAPEAVAPAVPTVRSIGSMFEAGSVNIAFHNADLFNVETVDSTTMFNATLCNGSCSFLFLAVVLDAPTAVGADANYVYIGDSGGIVWRYDPVADTITRLADTGVLANGTLTSFSGISGIAVDNSPANLGQVTVVDQTRVWKLISSAVPTITTLAPNQAPESSSPTVTINGTGFLPPLVVNTCPAITPGNVTFVSSTQITATFAINPVGPVGACDVTVTTANGQSVAASFTILIGPPALGVITPNSGFRGRTFPVSITGAQMGTNAVLNAIPGITFSGTVVTDTLITTNFQISPTATLGPQNVVVTTPSGPSNAVPFTITAAPPVLTTITPNKGVANSTVPVTIAGTDLLGSTLNLPTGFTLSGTPVVTSTSITATLLIDPTVLAGLQNITVTNTGGTSNAVTFTISPALTNIAPNTGRAGTPINVVITGTNLGNLSGVTAVNAGPNITVTNMVTTATTVSATFTTLANSPVGAQSITVTDASGNISNAVTFTITGPIPVINSITPNTGGTGATVPVSISGTGLTGATLNLPAGVTIVSGTLINNSFTTVNASLKIDGAAPLGAQSISVTTAGAGNTSNTLPFTVFALAPLLTSIAPTTAVAGNTIPVTLNGRGFGGTTSVDTAVGGGITVNSFTVNAAGTQITASFTIAADAITQGISVTNPSGTSNSVTFGIVPTLTSIATSPATSPTSGVAGKSVNVTLTGTSLIGATAIGTGGAGITLSNLVVVSSTQITATFAIAANAVQGNHNITVVTPGGTTAAVPFKVLPPAPVITSLNNTTISKASNNVGMNVNGTNLGNLPVGSFQVLLNGAPINPAFVTITNFAPSQTQIRFNWTFNASAPISGAGNAYTVMVTTPSGTSNAFPFTVTN